MKGFQPGVSGNPGGRPRGLNAKLRALFGNDVETAIEWLAKRFRDGRTPAAEKSQIAYWVIERYFGKAPQANFNINVDTELKSLTTEELYERAAEVIGRDPRFAGLLAQRGIGINPSRIIEAQGEGKPRI